MARKQSEIYLTLTESFVNNEIIQQRYGLTPGQSFDQQFSKVSIEAVLFHVVAIGIWTLETLFDEHKSWIEKKSKEIQAGSARWYRQQALNFQFGDNLIWNENSYSYEYEVINIEKQIIKLASVTETSTGILFKIAGLDANGNPVQLTNLEVAAFFEYIQKRKFAGTEIQIVSRPADLLRIYFRIYYNPLVIAADGSLLSNPSIKPVEITITEYLKNLPFDGVLNITSLTDIIQSAEGVVDPVFEMAESQYGSNPFVIVVDNYNSNAGYMEIDEDYPLSLTITYIAKT